MTTGRINQVARDEGRHPRPAREAGPKADQEQRPTPGIRHRADASDTPPQGLRDTCDDRAKLAGGAVQGHTRLPNRGIGHPEALSPTRPLERLP